MTARDTEKSEQYTPVNLSTPETETTHESYGYWSYKTSHRKKAAGWIAPNFSQDIPPCCGKEIEPSNHQKSIPEPDLRRYWLIGIFTCLFPLVLIIGTLAFTVTVLKKPCPALPTCPVVTCPDGWVGYQGKCYYFAKAERNWTSSKMHCSSLNASLAVIDSQEEMDFIRRYKGPADHWIGLQRILSQPWKWINGTTFNNWFTILGGGNYAYMNEEGFASSDCSREEPWICSKLAVT